LYKPVFTDGKGMPMHGVVVNAPMECTSVNKEHSIIIKIRPNPLTPP